LPAAYNAAVSNYAPFLSWIDSQQSRMVSLVTRWANINSGTYHLAGLHHLSQAIQLAFASLNADTTEHLILAPHQKIDSRGLSIEAPLANALRFRKRADAALRVFLCIHMDTVYPEDSLFQQTKLLEPNKLNGPGVTDAKGGIVIMLIALECLERFIAGTPDGHPGLGWEVLLNPDEEIGSPGSKPYLLEAAKRNHLGLLFEPALPDGSLASERKGSGNFAVVVRGRSAHAGRNPQDGRSAIEALAKIILALQELPKQPAGAGLTINVGQVEGGGALNMVPDLAIARFNVRIGTPDVHPGLQDHLHRLIAPFNRDGITAQLHGGITSPPTPPASAGSSTALLREQIAQCGKQIGLELNFRPTGGTCDGNRLAAAGLPCVDSLGARGDGIHSPAEFLYLDSLTERAKLTALLLMKMAAGDIELNT
jgi:glutamate carboxypeptidase